MRVQGRNTSRWSPSRVSFAHGLMVVAGLMTFVLVASVLRDREATVDVWVARSEVAAGSELTLADLDVVEIAATDPLLPSLLLAGPMPPVGRVRDVVGSGEPLLRSDLVAVDEVAAGRTFTIPIESVVLDGLGLSVQDRIDVIGLVSADPSGSAKGVETVAYVVVGVTVTRLPVSLEATAFAAASSRSAWVTVEVSEQQALELSAAIRHGDLQLVRSTGAEPIAGVAIDGGAS